MDSTDEAIGKVIEKMDSIEKNSKILIKSLMEKYCGIMTKNIDLLGKHGNHILTKICMKNTINSYRILMTIA